MTEINNPEYIIFIKIGSNTVAQVMLDSSQKNIISNLICGLCNENIKIGKEMPIFYE